ncbi:MAG TPA: hypothetical protein VFD58_20755 [Blastocatellia bacterium]|nr:hypothetical protein [Blastocatellia bacterium]
MIDFKILVLLFRFVRAAARKHPCLLPAALSLHLLLCMPSAAQSGNEKIAAGLWASREAACTLPAEEQELLATRLRQITGWKGLRFINGGELATGDIFVTEGGSALARRVLLKALRSGRRFVIEDHSGSPLVNFGQLDQGTDYEDVKNHIRLIIWRVRLDFQDFREMQASPPVREAFDPGLTLLHELLHGLGYRDTKVVGEIGECEQIINRIRTELGLPLRHQYHGEIIRLSPHITSVRLRFNIPMQGDNEGRIRWKCRYLFFLLPSQPDSGVNTDKDTGNGESSGALVE